MDELPAVIHRLSLRLWVPEYRAHVEEEQKQADNATFDGPLQDPLTSPPQDPVDFLGNVLSPSEIASLSLDSAVEIHSLFSQKSLLRLGALTDSQRTLSLFTPSIQEVVYRAWTGPTEQGDGTVTLISPVSPALSRTHSHVGSLHTSQDSTSTSSSYSRGSIAGYGLSLGAGRHSKTHSRKRKNRVVDLRRPKTTDDIESVSGESMYTETDSAPSVFSSPPNITEEKSDDPVTPPLSPRTTFRLPTIHERRKMNVSLPEAAGRTLLQRSTPDGVISEIAETSYTMPVKENSQPSRISDPDATPRSSVRRQGEASYVSEINENKLQSGSGRSLPSSALPFMDVSPGSSLVESALVMKIAGEIARRMQEEKSSILSHCNNYWDGRNPEEIPPPAYGP